MAIAGAETIHGASAALVFSSNTPRLVALCSAIHCWSLNPSGYPPRCAHRVPWKAVRLRPSLCQAVFGRTGRDKAARSSCLICRCLARLIRGARGSCREFCGLTMNSWKAFPFPSWPISAGAVTTVKGNCAMTAGSSRTRASRNRLAGNGSSPTFALYVIGQLAERFVELRLAVRCANNRQNFLASATFFCASRIWIVGSVGASPSGIPAGDSGKVQ